MDTYLAITSAFLGGCLVTALGFVASFTRKVGYLEKSIAVLATKLDGHINQQPGCALHIAIERQMSKNTEAIANLERQANTR